MEVLIQIRKLLSILIMSIGELERVLHVDSALMLQRFKIRANGFVRSDSLSFNSVITVHQHVFGSVLYFVVVDVELNDVGELGDVSELVLRAQQFVLSDDFSRLSRLLLVSSCTLRGKLSTLPSVLLGI